MNSLSPRSFPKAELTFSLKSFHCRQSFSDILTGGLFFSEQGLFLYEHKVDLTVDDDNDDNDENDDDLALVVE